MSRAGICVLRKRNCFPLSVLFSLKFPTVQVYCQKKQNSLPEVRSPGSLKMCNDQQFCSYRGSYASAGSFPVSCLKSENIVLVHKLCGVKYVNKQSILLHWKRIPEPFFLIVCTISTVSWTGCWRIPYWLEDSLHIECPSMMLTEGAILANLGEHNSAISLCPHWQEEATTCLCTGGHLHMCTCTPWWRKSA